MWTGWLNPDHVRTLIVVAFATAAFICSVAVTWMKLHRARALHPLAVVILTLTCALTSVILATSIASLLSGSVEVKNLQVAGVTINGQGQLVVFTVALVVIFAPLAPLITWQIRQWHQRQRPEPRLEVVATKGWPQHTMDDTAQEPR